MPTSVDTIQVSGQLLLNKDGDESLGDIFIYRRDDAGGRYARAGGHTNMGYSGYFLASIFDGRKWRKLQINELVPYAQRSFAMVAHIPARQAELAETVRGWNGLVAIYLPDRKAFTIKSVLESLAAVVASAPREA